MSQPLEEIRSKLATLAVLTSETQDALPLVSLSPEEAARVNALLDDALAGVEGAADLVGVAADPMVLVVDNVG